MKIKDYSKEDLETMSYNDIANMIIEEEGKKTTADLFKQIVELLEMPKKAFENKIGGFYTSMTKDKRFLLLEDGSWDLKTNHKVGDLISQEEDDDIEEASDYDDEPIEEEDEEDSTSYLDEQESDDDGSDEYKNLVIVDEEDLEQEE